MKFVIGLDNGRELEIQAPSLDAALLQASEAYPDASVIGIKPINEPQATETTEETELESDS